MNKFIIFLLLVFSIPAQAQIFDIYLDSTNNKMDSVDSNMYVDYFTPHIYKKPTIVSRYMGNQKSTIPTWDVSTYTGWKPQSTNLNKTSAALTDGSIPTGNNAIQLENSSIGIMLNTWSFPRRDVVGGGPHYIWSYKWDYKNDSSTPYPWINHNSDLTIQSRIKLPWVGQWGDSVGQISFVVYMIDTLNKKPLVMLVNLYDNRGLYNETIGNDGNPFTSTPLVDDMRYIKKSPFSAQHQSTTFDEKFFRAHITKDNIMNAINDLNNSAGYNYLSTNPANYAVTSANVLVEVFTPNNSNISMGMTIHNVMLLSCNNGDCSN